MSVWNYTLNDTSSMFQYEPYSDGIGLLNGWQEAFSISGLNTQGGEAGSGTSYHITQLSGASVTLSFFGDGITLYGTANCTYDVSIDGTLQTIGSSPYGTLLEQSGLNVGLHNIALTSQASGNNETLTFSGALITAPAEGDVTANLVDNQNTSTISYQGNWSTLNDPQIPNKQDPAPYEQTQTFNSSASMNFTGRAIQINGVKNWGWWTYDVILDGRKTQYNASSFWILPDAVLYYQDGLNNSETHSIEIVNLGSDGFFMSLNSFTVFRDDSDASDPATGSSSATSASPQATNSSSGSSQHKTSAGVIAGALVGALLGVAIIAFATFLFCRRRREKTAQSPTPFSETESDKYMDTKSNAQTAATLPQSLKGAPTYNYSTTPALYAFPTSPSSSAPQRESSPSEDQDQGQMIFRDSFFAVSNAEPLEPRSLPPRPEKSRILPTEQRLSRPLPAPPSRQPRSQRSDRAATIRSTSTSTEAVTVERIVEQVADRLADRLGHNHEAWAPPPSYAYSP